MCARVCFLLPTVPINEKRTVSSSNQRTRKPCGARPAAVPDGRRIIAISNRLRTKRRRKRKPPSSPGRTRIARVYLPRGLIAFNGQAFLYANANTVDRKFGVGPQLPLDPTVNTLTPPFSYRSPPHPTITYLSFCTHTPVSISSALRLSCTMQLKRYSFYS